MKLRNTIGALGAVLIVASACNSAAPAASSGGGGSADRSGILIEVVTHGQASDPFWSIFKNGVDAAGKDMGVKVEYSAPDTFDMPKMAALIDAAVAKKPAGLVAQVLLLAAAVFLLVAAFPRFLEVLNPSTIAAFVVFTVLGLAFGHFMAGPAPEDSEVLALASALRHPGIALAITAANFPTLQFGAVIILYLLIGAIVSIPYVKWMQKRTAALQIPDRKE